MNTHVALYLRISSDPTGERAGVQRQEKLCRDLVANQGWRVDDEHIYIDNDLSAYSQRKPRPAYQRMIHAIERGEINTVVAWHIDRLYRSPRELQDLLDVIKPLNVKIHTVLSGPYDLSTPDGILRAEIGASIGQYESAVKSERIKAKLIANAAEGKHHGGMRPYGYQADRVTPDPTEAAVVRKMAELILAGESCKSVARTLNKLGYKTATGKDWIAVTVRATLLRPRNVGLRVHHGEIVGEAKWQPILDREQWDRVCAILSDPARVKSPGRDGEIHLLSTVARCGVCGKAVVRAFYRPYKSVTGEWHRYPCYRCPTGHVSRLQSVLDAFIEKLVIERLRQPDVVQALAAPETDHKARRISEEITELERRLDEAGEAFAAGEITRRQLSTITVRLRDKLKAARQNLGTTGRRDVLAHLVKTNDPAKVWATFSPERRRAVVRLLMDITIHHSSQRGGGKFDYDTIEINWR